MSARPGDRVRLPDGAIAPVLGVLDDGTIRVQLDGDAVGEYSADQVQPITDEED